MTARLKRAWGPFCWRSMSPSALATNEESSTAAPVTPPMAYIRPFVVRSMALTQVPFALPAVQTIAAAIAAWPILTGLRRASALD